MPQVRLLKDYKTETGKVLPIGMVVDFTNEKAAELVKEKLACYTVEKKVKPNKP